MGCEGSPFSFLSVLSPEVCRLLEAHWAWGLAETRARAGSGIGGRKEGDPRGGDGVWQPLAHPCASPGLCQTTSAPRPGSCGKPWAAVAILSLWTGKRNLGQPPPRSYSVFPIPGYPHYHHHHHPPPPKKVFVPPTCQEPAETRVPCSSLPHSTKAGVGGKRVGPARGRREAFKAARRSHRLQCAPLPDRDQHRSTLRAPPAPAHPPEPETPEPSAGATPLPAPGARSNVNSETHSLPAVSAGRCRRPIP